MSNSPSQPSLSNLPSLGTEKRKNICGRWIKRLWNKEGLGFQMSQDCFLLQPKLIQTCGENINVEEDGRGLTSLG
jgi:hypothetical protein